MFQMIFSWVLTHINIFVLLQLPAPAGWSCCRQSLCLEILCCLSWWWGVAQVHDPPLESSRQNVSTSITVWRYVDRQLLSVTLYRSCSQQSVDSSDYHSVAGLVLERQRRISSPWTLSRTFFSWIPIIISCITVLMNVPRLSNLLSPLPYLAMYLKLTSRLYNINPRGKFLLEQLKTSHTNINLMQCLPFRTHLLETEKYRIWNFHHSEIMGTFQFSFRN